MGELAVVAENTDEKIMLAGYRAGEQCLTLLTEAAKPHPLLPGKLGPRRSAFIPVQDDGVIGLVVFCCHLAASRHKSRSRPPSRGYPRVDDQCSWVRPWPRQPTLRFSADSLPRLLTISYWTVWPSLS